MNQNGSRYALAALKDKRASIASDIVECERKLRHLKESLVHVDATLRLLDPELEPGNIPTKRPTRRVKLFRQGELGRMILDALRTADGPISTPAIVQHLLDAGGHGPAARKAVGQRVRGNLAYLERRGIVIKDGEQRNARWSLSDKSEGFSA